MRGKGDSVLHGESGKLNATCSEGGIVLKIDYPIYFTKKGNGWKNSSKTVNLKYKDGTIKTTSILTKADLKRGNFKISDRPVNGYFVDSNSGDKIRITNLMGGKKGKLKKQCPHCGKVKSLKKFDLSGRDTGGKRDQSNCNKCRGRY